MVMGVGVGSYNAAFMHLITHAVFKACLFLSAGSVIHSVHEQEMPKLGGLRKKLPYTFIAMMCCTLAIAGVPFFAGFVSKDRILGDALFWGTFAGQNKFWMIVPVLGFGGAFLTAFYMFRMMFLTFFGKPRDHHIYDHCHEEHIGFNSNIPLLILTVFTLGFWYCGTLTGQSFGKVFGSKTEWFKVLVEAPVTSKFVGRTRETLSSTDTRVKAELPKAVYEHQTGYVGPKTDDENGIHHAHTYGAIASIFIAFGGILLAFLMYIRGSVKPWAETFKGYTKILQNKYFFDELYIDVAIQKGLVPFNRFLAWVDMGVYDRFAVDGWAWVNRQMYRASKWFDDVIVDSIGVDGTGVAVNLFNLVLRIVQSGKIQFYFVVLIITLAGYVWTLKF
jgi:NADH-quinone oxidoreductase subunit L